METPTHCTLCPRRCGADRTRTHGLCGGGGMVKIARAALHFWEEPCISGTQGSGTVFFSGCPLQCCYCQNHGISAGNFGREISTRRLADIFLELQEQGAHNINLVTAGHYLPWVCVALDMARPGLHIPVVYNTGGYETPEAVAALRGYVDIWLADVKYRSPELSAEYSNAPDYFEAARRKGDDRAGRAACSGRSGTDAQRRYPAASGTAGRRGGYPRRASLYGQRTSAGKLFDEPDEPVHAVLQGEGAQGPGAAHFDV